MSVHVDDQLIACNSRKELDNFKKALNAAFECKDGGPADYFLGFNIHQDRAEKKLFISQEHYLTSMLEQFNMSDSKPARAPLPAGYKGLMGTDKEHAEAKHEPYWEMVGALLYAATTSRPNISFAVNLLARTTSKWNKSKVYAARHLLRYIKGTTDLCLAFDSTAGNRIALGYADADWGGCLETRRSTTGYLYTLGGGPVAWKSKRQATTALLTMEAEYMASSSAARQAAWLKQLLLDIRHDSSGPLKIYNDNNGALSLAKNPVFHDQAKRIDIIYHHLRNEIKNGRIDLTYIKSANNLADILTKLLPPDSHARLVGKMGMANIPVASMAK